ncbi:hypothetical protein DSOL_1429 [Desulfosporosinus metallidurans]|uniref:Uncharacterized protein n=1 Tax=Desulfosporosinus metallidurans TaxID=1888891 RepID=A0A1Q8QZ81_9FIRM|nr:hypothetical protein DSOL_1429 [Desulfosporosinus metallidurans]
MDQAEYQQRYASFEARYQKAKVSWKKSKNSGKPAGKEGATGYLYNEVVAAGFRFDRV